MLMDRHSIILVINIIGTPMAPISTNASASLPRPSPNSKENLTKFVQAYFRAMHNNPSSYPIDRIVTELYNDLQPEQMRPIAFSPQHLTVTTRRIETGAQSRVEAGIVLEKPTGTVKEVARNLSLSFKPFKCELLLEKLTKQPECTVEKYKEVINFPERFRKSGQEFQSPLARGGDFQKTRLPNKNTALFVAHLFENISRGYVYLHKHNLLHRDGKLTNYLYYPEKDQGKITDFGMLYDLEGGPVKQVLGTVTHFDPYSFDSAHSQRTGKGIQTKPTDLYYFARSLEEMLARKLFPMLLKIDPIRISKHCDLSSLQEPISDYNPDHPHYFITSFEGTIFKFDSVATRKKNMLRLANQTGDETAIALTELTYEILNKPPVDRMTSEQIHERLSQLAKNYTPRKYEPVNRLRLKRSRLTRLNSFEDLGNELNSKENSEDHSNKSKRPRLVEDQQIEHSPPMLSHMDALDKTLSL